MHDFLYERPIVVPNVADFSKKNMRYSGDIKPGKFDELFKDLVSPEAIVMMLTATDMNMNLPGMSGVASMMAHKFYKDLSSRGLWDQAKQFAGAVICYIHELNGYRKVSHNGGDVKRAVGYPSQAKQPKIFTNAQLYEKC